MDEDTHGEVGVLTPLRTYAVQSHELYTELVEAGFREEQAVVMLIGLTRKAGEGN